jgi:hypothetical protein
MHSTAAGYAPLAVAGGTQQRCEICSVGRAERRCARFAQRRSSPQGSSPRRPVEVSSGLLRLSRLHAPAVTDDAARARRPSGHTAAPPPRRRSEPPRAPWHLRCPAALGGLRTFAPDLCASLVAVLASSAAGSPTSGRQPNKAGGPMLSHSDHLAARGHRTRLSVWAT